MLSTESLLQRIEEKAATIGLSQEPRSLYEPVHYSMSLGGKRVRPLLALMACNLFTDAIDPAVNPALGLEVFHNFTLLHDDLMDRSEKRRGHPTVYRKWNENTAILSGDAMLIQAYQLIADTDKRLLPEIIRLFSQTALEVCEGQQYDMDFETETNISADNYLHMIRLKTAVLLACALKTGAIIGGATAADTGTLYEFGINIGIAFQLRDDYLDVYGDQSVFGKNIGGDILCNKKTALLVKALELANEPQKEQLYAWLNRTEYDPAEKISAVTAIYNELHIKEETEQQIDHFFGQAQQQFAKLPVEPGRTTILQQYVTGLMKRDL